MARTVAGEVMTRLNQDAEKVFAHMNVKVIDSARGELPYCRPRSAIDVRDHFHWTLTRAQSAIDLLVEQGRVKNNGVGFKLLKPDEKYVTYTAVT
jgi:predicted RNA-binding protein (virulence factor B family)